MADKGEGTKNKRYQKRTDSEKVRVYETAIIRLRRCVPD